MKLRYSSDPEHLHPHFLQKSQVRSCAELQSTGTWNWCGYAQTFAPGKTAQAR